jgi:hypothetical protein
MGKAKYDQVLSAQARTLAEEVGMGLPNAVIPNPEAPGYYPDQLVDFIFEDVQVELLDTDKP